jgi:hypothetical protein
LDEGKGNTLGGCEANRIPALVIEYTLSLGDACATSSQQLAHNSDSEYDQSEKKKPAV